MSFIIKKINHVQLAAPKGCETQAREFYGGILSLVEIEKPEELKKRGGVWFQLNEFQIHIGVEEKFVPAKKAHPALEVQNLDALKRNYQRKKFHTLKTITCLVQIGFMLWILLATGLNFWNGFNHFFKSQGF